MSRPFKCRFVCRMPKHGNFTPEGVQPCENVVMTVDEYEVIRLIDYEGYNQEKCSEQMRVARTTVQGIYDRARKKLADVIVNGKRLVIEGGQFSLCERFGKECEGGCARRCGKCERGID